MVNLVTEWGCSKCNREVNADLFGIFCPDCGHQLHELHDTVESDDGGGLSQDSSTAIEIAADQREGEEDDRASQELIKQTLGNDENADVSKGDDVISDGWWLCSDCHHEVNGNIHEDDCPDCGHTRCHGCRILGGGGEIGGGSGSFRDPYLARTIVMDQKEGEDAAISQDPLLRERADVDAPTARGTKKAVELILQHTAVNAFTTLQVSSDRGHREIVKLLLQEGADVDVSAALVAASARGNKEVVELKQPLGDYEKSDEGKHVEKALGTEEHSSKFDTNSTSLRHSNLDVPESHVDSGYYSLPKPINQPTLHETDDDVQIDMKFPQLPLAEDIISVGDQTIQDIDTKDLIFDHFLALFENDKTLRVCFSRVIDDISKGNLTKAEAEQRLQTFFMGFSALLRRECKNSLQLTAVRFLRHRPRAFATQLFSKDELPEDQNEITEEDRITRERFTEEWVNKLSRNSPFSESTTEECHKVELIQDAVDFLHVDTEMEMNELHKGLVDVLSFLEHSRAMDEFRAQYQAFVNGENIERWNTLLKAKDRILREDGNEEADNSIPTKDQSLTPFIGPVTEADAAVKETDSGFNITWKCKCRESFTMFVPGGDRDSAKNVYTQILDRNKGSTALICEQRRWLRNLLWSIRPQKPYISSFSDLATIFLPRTVTDQLPGVSSENGSDQHNSDNELVRNGRDIERGSDENQTNATQERENSRSLVQRASNALSMRFAAFWRSQHKLTQPKSSMRNEAKQFICTYFGRPKDWWLSHAEIREINSDEKITDEEMLLALQELLVKWQIFRPFKKFSPFIPFKFELYEFDVFAKNWVLLGEKYRFPHQYLAAKPLGGGRPDKRSSTTICSGSCKPGCIVHDWNYERLEDEELEEYKRQFESGYIEHFVWMPKDTPPGHRSIARAFPFKRREKLSCHDRNPQKGWGFVVQLEWDWSTFLIWWGLVLALAISVGVISCWKAQCTATTRISLISTIMAGWFGAMAVISYIGKQNGTIR